MTSKLHYCRETKPPSNVGSIPGRNPHLTLRAIGPPVEPGDPEAAKRRWRCADCGMIFSDISLVPWSCTYDPPPCSSCGWTPLCSPGCVGVATTLELFGIKPSEDPR